MRCSLAKPAGAVGSSSCRSRLVLALADSHPCAGSTCETPIFLNTHGVWFGPSRSWQICFSWEILEETSRRFSHCPQPCQHKISEQPQASRGKQDRPDRPPDCRLQPWLAQTKAVQGDPQSRGEKGDELRQAIEGSAGSFTPAEDGRRVLLRKPPLFLSAFPMFVPSLSW
jgi:hypothetical protein